MKHAFLIMAHNNFKVLQVLLESLDFEGSEIYLHINKKTKNTPVADLINSVKVAKLHFVPSIKVKYCNYSMTRAIISLLSSATESAHDYYHILSGADLLIKKPDDFLSFFAQNKGKEFVGFSMRYNSESVDQKNYFVPMCRSNYRYISLFAIWLRKTIIQFQKLIGYSAISNLDWEVKKGCDWYSVTHNAALYLLKQEKKFRKYFYRSFCPTEFFAQTVLFNSPFRNAIYSLSDENVGSLRFVDWSRGNPYVFRITDWNLLKNSQAMFARKFMEDIDYQIVERILNHVKEL